MRQYKYTHCAFLSFFLSICLLACNKTNPTYNLIYHPSPNIVIDGHLNERHWLKANILEQFIYPWDSTAVPITKFMSFTDKDNLYIAFELVEKSFIQRNIENDSLESIALSDRVEVFFAKDLELSKYYGLEIDLWGRYYDFKGVPYRNIDYDWNWPKPKGIEIKTSISNQHCSVEMKLDLSSLKKLGLIQESGEIIAGIFRADFYELNIKSAVRWMSWQKPDSVEPDFHIPSAFGILKMQE